MKKIGKKLSFLTKIMLVFGLLISNLSSLSVVFASENVIDVNVVDDKLNIKYLEELAEEVETVRVKVYENYTYLDESFYVDPISSLSEIVNSYDLTEEEVDMLVSTEEDKVLVLDSILDEVVFDGTYEVKVEIIDTTDVTNVDGVLIDSANYVMANNHDSGLEISVFDAVTNNKLEVLNNGKYAVDATSTKVNVVAKVLAGGLNPSDMFLYNDVEYMAIELLEREFSSEMDFTGLLFGDYNLPVVVELDKYNYETEAYEKVQYPDEELNLEFLYGTYELDAVAMNTATEELELNKSYKFYGNSKNGYVYVLLNSEKVNTMLDLYKIANLMFGDDEKISYLLSNSQYEDVLSTYDETTMTITLEEYLDTIKLDDTAMLSLMNTGLTITYKVVVAGDNNNDNVINEEDLSDLINQVLGNKDVNLEKSDLYKNDGKVNTLDVMYLDQVNKNKDWDVTLSEKLDAAIATELQVVETDVVSGQKFTVNYIVKLSDYMVNGVGGLFTYDESAVELNSIEVANNWLGNSKDGKFLYVGDESLELPVIEETPEEDDTITDTDINDSLNNDTVVDTDVNIDNSENIEEIDINDENQEEDILEVVTKDYVVLSATFTAKKAGEHTISVKDIEYFNQDTYYGVSENEVSTTVLVNASNNNNLSTLTVAGIEIVLEDAVLDYEITVGNDVTVADVNAMVQNVAANITSIVSPEELVEGENMVTITVTAENGDIKVYTIKVIREESEKEETTQVNYDNYYNNYEDDNDDEEENEVIVTDPVLEDKDEEDSSDKEEDSNLSRIIIIILILLVIAGLIYLIFKDEDDEETKKINKEVNKLKKEEKIQETKVNTNNRNSDKINSKTNNKNNVSKNKNTNYKKKDK